MADAGHEGTTPDSANEAAPDASAPHEAPGGAASSSEPDQEGAGTAVCDNCGTPLDGLYCSHCGQRDRDRIVPVWHMANEFLEELLECDFRILRTLPAFLFKPGHLTEAYVNGQRRRYVRPLRLYLFASFLLFTVLALQSLQGLEEAFFQGPSAEAVETELAGAQQALAEAQTQLEEASGSAAAAAQAGVDAGALERMTRRLAAEGIDSTQIQAIKRAVQTRTRSESVTAQQAIDTVLQDSVLRDSVLQPLSDTPEAPSGNWREAMAKAVLDTSETNLSINIADRETNERLEPIVRTNVARALRNPRAFVSSMIDMGPYLMFMLLPAFAFLLKLVYIRRGRLYAEHFVFTIHAHAFAFVAFAVSALLGASSVSWLSEAALWVGVAPLAYIVIAMKRVYNQGFLKTSAKALFVFSTYSILLLVGFVILAVAAVLLF